jgi:CheY-like chemotaxis protein
MRAAARRAADAAMRRHDPARGAADGRDGAAADAADPLAGLRVLVVDDAAVMRGTIAGVLKRAGARVRAFEDPLEALAAIEGDPAAWDLLVTDHDMPQMSGSELAFAARIAAPDMPMLLCTGLPDWHGRPGRDTALFDALVGKPVDGAALLSGVRAALGRRAAAEA